MARCLQARERMEISMRLRTSLVSAVACVSLLGVMAPTAHADTATANSASVAASSAYPMPTGVVYGYDGSVHLAWNHIRGVRCYLIEITKRGYYGPWPWMTTTHDGITIPVSGLPYKSAKLDQPYDFLVRSQDSCSAAPRHYSAYASVSAFLSLPPKAQKLPVNSKSESSRQKRDWQKLVNECGNAGATTMLETAAGGALAAAIAIWIPAVGEVTVAAVAAAAAAAGVVADVSCLAKGSVGSKPTVKQPNRSTSVRVPAKALRAGLA